MCWTSEHYLRFCGRMLKCEDGYNHRGRHGIDIEGSFNLKTFGFPAQMFLGYLLLFLWSVSHCTNSPQDFFFPLIFWCSFDLLGESCAIPSTIHLPHFFLFNLFTCTEKQKISSLLYGCNDDLTVCCCGQFKPQTKPSWRGRGGHRNMMASRENQVYAGKYFSLFCR